MKPSLFIGDKTHQELSQLLSEKRSLTLSGLSNETAKALILSSLYHHKEQQMVLITDSQGQTSSLSHWLSFFNIPVQVIGNYADEDGDIVRESLQQFLLCMEEEVEGVVLCSREVWEENFPLYTHLQEESLTLSRKQKIDFTQTIEQLIERGYAHGEDLYLNPGEYRRTGDVLTIFPIQAEHSFAVRLDFEEIEKMEKVDLLDLSKTHGEVDELILLPVHEGKLQPLSEQIPNTYTIVLDDQDDISAPLTHPYIRLTSFPEGEKTHVHLRYLSVLKFYTLSDFLNDVKDKLIQKWSLIVVTKRAEELQGICEEENIPYTVGEKRKEGALSIIPAEKDDLLPHSLQNPDLQCALLTDREIFSLKKTQKQKSVAKLALDFITSLSPGDFVVHMEHGIGHFEGMTQKEFNNTLREYLELTYAEGDKLFIPVDQADKLSKFVHEEGSEPHLTRLGTNDWKKVTAKMKEETEKIAKELLDLYAKRAKAKGFSYGEDSDNMKKFEAAFPYQETPGQLKAISDIKNDMQDTHPMDRLVCGDVGFGKTEVAMRAAFKAVQDGKQVAVVCPITILAQQHFLNFQKRMQEFGVRIEMLSRFRSAAEQKKILEKLRKGDLDIVVGTHRLLQPDIKFHNLGLVIIDEEQRFGVKQKEALTSLRASVDILTLTATPIPRTLNLGLHKLRDITTITTPPPGRLPIITEVRKYSDQLIAQAIQTEMDRDGQIYVLHNRVETIDAFADKLRELLPKAKFVVAHGQLKPEELEKRVGAFKEGEFDVLVSSTIIENGIDLPRANTLIVNGAELFGLSQLYQLRGRVGRGKLQAYAYFLYHGQKLKDDAKKRLRAIVEACELGSGFQVAMRDLEIRGAGEILGSSQSGTMHTVGVSHYLRMLKAAVEDLQSGQKGDIEEELNVEILLPVEALIPSFYITDEQEKIAIYQKLAGSEDTEILKEFEQDLVEEFGALPHQVELLFAILKLKITCRKSGVSRVKMEEGAKSKELVLTLSKRVEAKDIMKILSINPQWRISGSSLKINFEHLCDKQKDEEWIEELRKQIEALSR